MSIGATCWSTLAARRMAWRFIPRFAENGYFFVTYILDPMTPADNGSRLSRFTARAGDRLVADAASEKIILEWPSGGHNGGCIRFGPDGYLYLATGDGSGIADELQTGQKIDDLVGSILRIDVDRPERRAAVLDSRRQSVRRPHRMPAAKSGRSAIARSGSSASIRPPSGCGPAKWARTCGRWST